MRSSNLSPEDRKLLQRYVPNYGTAPATISSKSLAVFLAVLYQNDLDTVVKNMNNPVYGKYYKYYLTMQKIVAMIRCTDTIGILHYSYVVDIYGILFDIDRDTLPPINNKYDSMIVAACSKMDDIIEGMSKDCDIAVVSDVMYRFMNLSISNNMHMDYIVGYIVVNYLLIYLGYTVMIPIYEADDVLNSLVLTDVDPRAVKSLIGKKLLYGLDYTNDIIYRGGM